MKRIERIKDDHDWSPTDTTPTRFARLISHNITLSELARLAAQHGHALVPEEPSEEMQQAMMNAVTDGITINDDAHRSVRHGYRAMIAAGRVKP